jgi:6-phosphofructo-2-kinase
MDPVLALEDFQKRVTNYEKAYESIGEYEEEIEDIQYCKVALSLCNVFDIR